MKVFFYVWLQCITCSYLLRTCHGCCRNRQQLINNRQQANSTTNLCTLNLTTHSEVSISPKFKFHFGTSDPKGNKTVFKEAFFIRNNSSLLQSGRQRRNAEDTSTISNAVHYNDYIQTGRNLSWEESVPRGAYHGKPYLVELQIVVHKDWADVFGQDPCSMVDYIAEFMTRVNKLYSTLRSVHVSFRVNGIVVMNNKDETYLQGDARCGYGGGPFQCPLDRLKKWIPEHKEWLIKHDLTSLIWKPQEKGRDGREGLATLNGTCYDPSLGYDKEGVGVWYDDGQFGKAPGKSQLIFEPLITAAHELGHNIGAEHDDDKCGHGFIMGYGGGWLKKSFSKCSNDYIAKFVSSNEGACLLVDDG